MNKYSYSIVHNLTGKGYALSAVVSASPASLRHPFTVVTAATVEVCPAAVARPDVLQMQVTNRLSNCTCFERFSARCIQPSTLNQDHMINTWCNMQIQGPTFFSKYPIPRFPQFPGPPIAAPAPSPLRASFEMAKPTATVRAPARSLGEYPATSGYGDG